MKRTLERTIPSTKQLMEEMDEMVQRLHRIIQVAESKHSGDYNGQA